MKKLISIKKKSDLENNYIILNNYLINKIILSNFKNISKKSKKDKEFLKFLNKYLKISKHPLSVKKKNSRLLIKNERSLISMLKYIFNKDINIQQVKKNFFFKNILNWEDFYNNSLFFKNQNQFIINKIANSKKKISILEFGSGTGSIAYGLYKKLLKKNIFFNFYITDLNSSFLKRINSRISHKNVKFKILDINNFKINVKFDFILLNNVFHLIKDYQKFNKQLSFLLKKDSQILIHENYRSKKFKILLFELIYMCFDDFRNMINSKKHMTYKIRFKNELLDLFKFVFREFRVKEFEFSSFSSVFLLKKKY